MFSLIPREKSNCNIARYRKLAIFLRKSENTTLNWNSFTVLIQKIKSMKLQCPSENCCLQVYKMRWEGDGAREDYNLSYGLSRLLHAHESLNPFYFKGLVCLYFYWVIILFVHQHPKRTAKLNFCNILSRPTNDRLTTKSHHFT